jgi:RNA polymerase sigma-70 factor, ECF subfamily
MVSRSRFEALVIPHRNSAFNLAYWILQSREDAEDAVQDAYVRAFRAFDTFAGAGVRSWLLAIVRNVAYTALAARRRSRKVIALSEELSFGDDLDLDLDAVSRDPSPEAALIVREEQQFLLDALTRLHPIHRDILVLREMEGLSYAEISQIMGTAVGTVMSRLSRARAELLRSGRSRFREPQEKSKAVPKGEQYSKRSLDIKPGVAAAYGTRNGDDRESISPGSRCRPKVH